MNKNDNQNFPISFNPLLFSVAAADLNKIFSQENYFLSYWKHFSAKEFFRNLRMTISRSLNFSLFQSSSNSSPKEEDVEDDEEDYDWGG